MEQEGRKEGEKERREGKKKEENCISISNLFCEIMDIVVLVISRCFIDL